MSRSTCAPNPGWHGYWLNPGDAGLPMDVQWQLPRGLFGWTAALSGAEPSHRRRPHELCLRARLCRARPAQGAGGRARNGADPRRRPLARVHRQDLRARAGATRARPAGRQRDSEPRAVRRVAASACRSRWRRSAISKRPATRSASQSRFRRASASASRTCSRSPTRWSITRRSRTSAASGDMLIAELKRTGAAPAQFAGVLALGDGRGLEFHAVPGIGAGRRNADRRSRCERDPVGGAWRAGGRNPAQPDAVRLPDSRAQGPAPVARRERCGARALGCARLHGGHGRWHRRARRSPVGAPGCGCRCGLGIPAAGPANDHAVAPARGRDHRSTCCARSNCRRSADARSRPEASAPARSPHSSQRRAPDRSLARRLGPPCCFRWPARCWCLRRSDSASRFRSCSSRSFRCSGTGSPSPARGWRVCSDFSPFQWRRAPWRQSGCFTGWAASPRSLPDWHGRQCCWRCSLRSASRNAADGRVGIPVATLALVFTIVAIGTVPKRSAVAASVPSGAEAVERDARRR